MPSDCCYFVDKAAAAAAAPALYYFGSILHCISVFTQNLGQTLQGIEACHIRSIILPLLAYHVLREANHYIRLLSNC